MLSSTFMIFGQILLGKVSKILVASDLSGFYSQLCWAYLVFPGPNCNVLAMYPVYSKIGPCHRRDVAWMVSITPGNGRPVRRVSVYWWPLHKNTWDLQLHSRIRWDDEIQKYDHLIFNDICCLLDALVVFWIVFLCSFLSLPPFLSRL